MWLIAAWVFWVGIRLEVQGRMVTLHSSLLGCVAGMLCLYNLVRWWSVRSYPSQRQLLRDTLERRQRDEVQPSRPERVPDPNFDFTDRPPG
jgi:hypothetical protein